MRFVIRISLTAVLFLSGCQKQDTEQPIPTQELRFCAYLEEGGEIRPMTRSVAGDPLSAGYYLTGLLSNVDYPAGVNYQRLMWNVEMNKDGSYKSTSTKYFWAEGDATLRHTFVAYSAAPSGSTGGPTTATLAGATSAQPLLSLDYTNADDPLRQVDFLYADNSRNLLLPKYAPEVNLIFKHRLARVVVKVIGTGGVSLTECQASVRYNANAVKNSGKVFLSNNGTINLGSTYHASGTGYKLGTSFTVPGSANTAATAVEAGDLILLPGQSLAEGWAALTLSYKPDGAITAQSASVDLPAINLASFAAQQYNVLVNIIVESQNLSVSGVTLTDWMDKSGTIDKL